MIVIFTPFADSMDEIQEAEDTSVNQGGALRESQQQRALSTALLQEVNNHLHPGEQGSVQTQEIKLEVLHSCKALCTDSLSFNCHFRSF